MNHTRSTSDHHHNHNHNHNHPSFSSSLLEQIYRSFDDDDDDPPSLRYNNKPHHHHHHHRNIKNDNNFNNHHNNINYNTNNSSSNCCYLDRSKDDDKFRVHRSFVLDQWMENNTTKANNSMAVNNSSAKLINYSSSSTSSSDSSSGICGFSCSDADSLYASSKSNNFALKPIKTKTLTQPQFHRNYSSGYSDDFPPKNKSKEGNLHKRALKLYGDLKKVKQPISPGGKLASFLNSLFNSNASSKKPKISSSSSSSKSTPSNGAKLSASTPSTASSYSRSCLSKTPSSAGRFERRSVRFCPVSTVMAYNDKKEESNQKASRSEELKVQIMEKHRRVEEVAKELLKNYHHGRKYQSDVNNHKKNNSIRSFQVEDEDDEDDDASCCSSDLFELDHLLEVGGNQRYCEELPVYETTHVDTNRAIANGFIL